MRAITLQLLSLVFFAGVAPATPVIDFRFVISGTSIGAIPGSFDSPVLSLQNTTTGGVARISSFSFTVGDTTRNYDWFSGQQGAGLTGAGSYTPDTVQAGARADYVSAGFTNFDPNDIFVFKVDIDLDSILNNDLQTDQDFRTVFFNNGDGPNARLTVNFVPSGSDPSNTISSPTTIAFFLKDRTAGLDAYEFTAANSIPEPGTLLTFAAGIGAIFVARMRRR